MQGTGYRKPDTGYRKQAIGCRMQYAGSWLQDPGYRIWETGCRIGYRIQDLGNRIGYRIQDLGNRMQDRTQDTGYRIWETRYSMQGVNKTIRMEFIVILVDILQSISMHKTQMFSKFRVHLPLCSLVIPVPPGVLSQCPGIRY